jgi:predicted cupin superfamily sugar epimerase
MDAASAPPEDAASIIGRLGLQPHPEGGHYRETWRAEGEGRAAGTAIYFLLARGERSHWHRIDSFEIWHHYAGGPLELATWDEGTDSVLFRILGSGLTQDENPQLIVAADQWQSARPLGGWTLAGCTVSPGFEFDHFELAAAEWSPPPLG